MSLRPKQRDRTPVSLVSRVEDVMRLVAAREVLPRYQALQDIDVEEKSPGDLVTIADHAVEVALAQALGELLPEVRFVGEERCAREPALLAGLTEGTVWVVDPIDGTGNFAAGRPPFAIMVALLREGEIIASWIHDPLTGRMASAELGGGAWIDGERVTSAEDVPERSALTGVISSFAMPDTWRAPAAALERSVGEILPSRRCAGDEYPLVATGERHFALYWRTLVWDHAPGVLFLTEAGGVAERPDGTAYRPGVPGTGMLLAHNPAIADVVCSMLQGGDGTA